MKKYTLDQFTRGWIIGDFEPNIIRTKDFECTVRSYVSGDKEQKHLHKIADEVTIVINGKFIMNDELLTAGDIIHLSPGDPTDFECVENGTTTVIKTPSVMGDKYTIN